MIVTLTANTTVDHVVFIPSFEMNQTIRASRVMQSMGGKPTDASWILGEMGIPSLALGFAAGITGEAVKSILHSKGVTTDFIPVEGDSRRNLIIVTEDGSGQSTITASTLEVSPEHIVALRERFSAALDEATVVVMGGTLPSDMNPSFYTEFVGMARQRDLPVIFDASEPYLSPGLQSRPTYIKPNEHELGELVGKRIKSVEDAYHAGREIVEQYGTCPVISLGADGGLAVLEDRAYRIPRIDVPVTSTAGAGDGVLAGLARSVFHGEPIEEGLRWGFAAATAVVTMPGTAECRRPDIEKYYEQVELLPYAP